ncbi:MAG: hypothetical protein DDT19_00887 [Syntrophomonadaceae bacterium]|nr:hypothetical protein [Bacillota bacterium]
MSAGSASKIGRNSRLPSSAHGTEGATENTGVGIHEPAPAPSKKKGERKMTIQEAKKEAKKYKKAEVWYCPAAKQAEVMVYTNEHSNQWYQWTGEWEGYRPVIPGCSCSRHDNSHIYYDPNGREIA